MNGLQALAVALDLSDGDLRTIAPRVMQALLNDEHLRACSRHDFSEDLTPDHPPHGKRWRCTRCTGEVTGNDKRWYECGLGHADQGVK